MLLTQITFLYTSYVRDKHVFMCLNDYQFAGNLAECISDQYSL